MIRTQKRSSLYGYQFPFAFLFYEVLIIRNIERYFLKTWVNLICGADGIWLM